MWQIEIVATSLKLMNVKRNDVAETENFKMLLIVLHLPETFQVNIWVGVRTTIAKTAKFKCNIFHRG